MSADLAVVDRVLDAVGDDRVAGGNVEGDVDDSRWPISRSASVTPWWV